MQTTRPQSARLARECETGWPDGAVHGVAFERTRLVLAVDAYLVRLVPETGRAIDRLETFPARGGLTFDGRYLWQKSGGYLQQLDTRTGFVVQSIAPDLSQITGFACWERDLLILHQGGRRLARVHVTRLRVEAHPLSKQAIVVGEAETHAPLHGLSWSGGDLWSTTPGNLVRVDPATGAILERVSLPEPFEVCDLAADVDGRFWCVDGATRKVRVFVRPGWGDGHPSPLRLAQSPPSSRVTEILGGFQIATQPPEGAPHMAAPAIDAATASAGGVFARVLVPVDFTAASRHALATAMLLQQRLGSEIHLFHMTEQGPNFEFLAGAGARVGYDDLVADFRGELLRFVDNVFPGCASGVKVHARGGHDLAEAIADVARVVGATLVLLVEGQRQTVFRSRIEKVAHDLHGAVLVLRAPSGEGPTRDRGDA
jgi:nucleotide-binding universal stress UspA family protein